MYVTILGSKSHVVPLNPKRASHHNSVASVEIVSAEKAIQAVRQQDFESAGEEHQTMVRFRDRFEDDI